MPLPYYELAYGPRAGRWTLIRHDPPTPGAGGATPPPTVVGTYADETTLAQDWVRRVAPRMEACRNDTLDGSAS